MTKLFFVLAMIFSLVTNAYAADWTKPQTLDNDPSTGDTVKQAIEKNETNIDDVYTNLNLLKETHIGTSAPSSPAPSTGQAWIDNNSTPWIFKIYNGVDWTTALKFPDAITIDTLTLDTGSITDSSAAISFGNENLSTTGTLDAGATSVTGNLTASGNITASGIMHADHYVQIDGDTNPYILLDDSSYNAYVEVASSILNLKFNGNTGYAQNASGGLTLGVAGQTTTFNSDLAMGSNSITTSDTAQVDNLNAELHGGYSAPQGADCYVGVETSSVTIAASGTTAPVIFNDDSTDHYHDDGGNYNTSTGFYTCPTTGKYLVSTQLTMADINDYNYIYLAINGVVAARSEGVSVNFVSTNMIARISGVVLSCTAGQTISVEFYNGDVGTRSLIAGSNNNFMSITRLE